jgi:endonuclease YncB( thermonuclease family)
MDLDSQLLQVESCTPEVRFPFGKRTYRVRVVSVYDGDTAQIIFKHDNTLFQMALRVLGIDTPERQKTAGVVKQMAEAARVFAHQLLMTRGCLHYATFTDWDKYGGRLLGHLQVACQNNMDFGQIMLQRGYAVPYAGGARLSSEEWQQIATKWSQSGTHPI